MAEPMVWPSHCLGRAGGVWGSKRKGPPLLGLLTVHPVRMEESAVTSAWGVVGRGEGLGELCGGDELCFGLAAFEGGEDEAGG